MRSSRISTTAGQGTASEKETVMPARATSRSRTYRTARTARRTEPAELSNVFKIMTVQGMLAATLVLLVLVIKLFSAETYENLKMEYNKMTSITTLQDIEEEKDRYLEVFQQLAEQLQKDGGAGGVTVDGVTYNAENMGNLKGATLAPYYLLASPIAPVQGTITSAFGFRMHPLTGKPDFHTGTDIAAAEGTEILAALGGTVTEVGYNDGYGNYVEITHSSGLQSYYKHCSEVLMREGDTVTRGQAVALVGSTGVSTGPHLHFELRLNGQFVNPAYGVDLSC